MSIAALKTGTGQLQVLLCCQSLKPGKSSAEWAARTEQARYALIRSKAKEASVLINECCSRGAAELASAACP